MKAGTIYLFMQPPCACAKDIYRCARRIFFLSVFVLLIPVFIIYAFLTLTVPFLKLGKIKRGGPIRCYIYKDAIHSDYVFESSLWSGFFEPRGRFIKIGWGDRKIFLETKSWGELELKNFIKAFFGMNETVLRVDFMDNLEDLSFLDMSPEQFEFIVNHVRKSTNGVAIKKLPCYYQKGDFYESDLSYNCFTNCNNWINLGLRSAKVSNRLWCPLTIWIDGDKNGQVQDGRVNYVVLGNKR